MLGFSGVLGGWLRAPARFDQDYCGFSSRLALVARAQQTAMQVIGWLSARSPAEAASVLNAFRQGAWLPREHALRRSMERRINATNTPPMTGSAILAISEKSKAHLLNPPP
jgi:hypothetical protein